MGVTAWQTPVVVDVFPDGNTISTVTPVITPNDGQYVALSRAITNNAYFPGVDGWAWRGHVAIQGRFTTPVTSLVPAGAIITGVELEIYAATGSVRMIHSATLVDGIGGDAHYNNGTNIVFPSTKDDLPPAAFERMVIGGESDRFNYAELSDPAAWPDPVFVVAYFEFLGTQGRIWLDSIRLRYHYIEQPVAGFPNVAGRLGGASGVTGAVRKMKRIGGTINAVAGFQTGSVFLGARRTLPSSSNPSPISSAAGFRFAALTNQVGGTVKNVYMNGRVGAESTVRGTLVRGPKVFRGLWIQGASAVTGRIGKGRRIVSPKWEIDATVSGRIIRRAHVAGTVAAASALSGAVRRMRRVAGSIAGVSTTTGALLARRGVYGTVAADGKVVGTLNRVVKLTNDGAAMVVAAQSGVTGTLRRVRPLPAPSVIAAQSGVSGELLNSFLLPQDDNVHRVPSVPRGHVVPSVVRTHEVS
jgi:hypothetical protein